MISVNGVEGTVDPPGLEDPWFTDSRIGGSRGSTCPRTNGLQVDSIASMSPYTLFVSSAA